MVSTVSRSSTVRIVSALRVESSTAVNAMGTASEWVQHLEESCESHSSRLPAFTFSTCKPTITSTLLPNPPTSTLLPNPPPTTTTLPNQRAPSGVHQTACREQYAPSSIRQAVEAAHAPRPLAGTGETRRALAWCTAITRSALVYSIACCGKTEGLLYDEAL